MLNKIIFLFYSASGTAGIETNSQFPVESDSTDAETNDESGNSTELHHPESEAPQKIEGKMCVYDYLYYFEIIILFIQPQVLVLRHSIVSPL